MSLFLDHNVSEVYYGTHQITEAWYSGFLVYASRWVLGDKVFEQTTAGNYIYTIEESGVYDVFCVGAGGGWACGYKKGKLHGWNTWSGGGGSGAGFRIRIRVVAPFECSGVVGTRGYDNYGSGGHTAGNGSASSFLNILASGGAGGGAGPGDYGQWGGAGGSRPTIPSQIEGCELMEVINASSGNTGGVTHARHDSTKLHATSYVGGPFSNFSKGTNVGAGRNFYTNDYGDGGILIYKMKH